MQMLTSECMTDKCHARGCNLPTAQAQIHIAAGDSQAAVPFPKESEGISTLHLADAFIQSDLQLH